MCGTEGAVHPLHPLGAPGVHEGNGRFLHPLCTPGESSPGQRAPPTSVNAGVDSELAADPSGR